MTDYAAFAALGVATVHEAAGRVGIVDLALTQVVPGSRVAGPARTARCTPGDNTMVHAVVAHAKPGDVLVLTSAEPEPVALVGELLATQAQVRGVAAMLIDGAVRDLDELARARPADLVALRTRAGRDERRGRGARRHGGDRRREIQPGDLVVLDPTARRAAARAGRRSAPARARARRARARDARALCGGRAFVRPNGLREIVEG